MTKLRKNKDRCTDFRQSVELANLDTPATHRAAFFLNLRCQDYRRSFLAQLGSEKQMTVRGFDITIHETDMILAGEAQRQTDGDRCLTGASLAAGHGYSHR